MTKPKILLVDDDATVLRALTKMLAQDYQLSCAASGAEALQMIAIERPQLVLLDLKMPDMDGLQVLSRVRENATTADLAVIILTGNQCLDTEASALELGATDYITKPVHTGVVQARVRNALCLVRCEQLDQANLAAIEMLGIAGHFKDNDTGYHVWRMADYAAVLAKEVGLDDAEVGLLRLAATMHDIGKIGIPDAIIGKPGALNEAESELMKGHAEIGYRILQRGDSELFRMAAIMALYHHERWDGLGYPRKLSGADIPLYARIAAVADVFDALTTERPYKSNWHSDAAFEYIARNRGEAFDPEIVDALLCQKQQILDIQRAYAQLERQKVEDFWPLKFVQSGFGRPVEP